jgi:hypothetical protein
VVALGRVIMGDIAVSLVDLAVRGLLVIGESAPDAGDWRLASVLAPAPGHRLDAVLPYERALLDGLAGDGGPADLASVRDRVPALCDKVRSELVREAVHRGWLRHLHHDQRTAKGEELAQRIRSFQRDLRGYVSSQGGAMPDQLLPYALHFGLAAPAAQPLARFAHAWVAAFGALPGWQPRGSRRVESDVIEIRSTESMSDLEAFMGML